MGLLIATPSRSSAAARIGGLAAIDLVMGLVFGLGLGWL